MSLLQQILTGLDDLGLSDHADKAEALSLYLALIDRWNRVTNLTAIRQREEMVSAHLLDSLSVLPFVTGSKILDVGSGAGLPGIPLALFQPDKDFILLDSNGKKTRFMTQAAIELKLGNVTVLQQRIEDCTDQFDQVISRAFASLEDFMAECMPRVKPGGSLLAMKGPAEIEQANAIHGAKLHELAVPGLEKARYLLEIASPAEADS